MNREEMQALLADYLGDELEPAQRERLEANLATDPEFAAEVAGLRESLALMRSLDRADAASAGRRPCRRVWWQTAVVRYAAAVLIGFGTGYLIRDLARSQDKGAGVPRAALDRPIAPLEEVPPEPRTDRPSWQVEFAHAYASQPSRSSLARSLAALAHVTR